MVAALAIAAQVAGPALAQSVDPQIAAWRAEDAAKMRADLQAALAAAGVPEDIAATTMASAATASTDDGRTLVFDVRHAFGFKSELGETVSWTRGAALDPDPYELASAAAQSAKTLGADHVLTIWLGARRLAIADARTRGNPLFDDAPDTLVALDRSLDLLTARLGADNTATIEARGARARGSLKRLDPAGAERTAAPLAAASLAPPAKRVALAVLADVRAAQARFAEAEALDREALALPGSALESARAGQRLAARLIAAGKIDEAETLLAAALKAAEADPGDTRLLRSDIFEAQGDVAFYREDFKAAAPLHQASLDTAWDKSRPYGDFSDVRWDRKNRKRVASAFRVGASRATLDTSTPQCASEPKLTTPTDACALAGLIWEIEQDGLVPVLEPEAHLAAYNTAAARFGEHPLLADGLARLAQLRAVRGDYAGAEPLARRAFAIRTRTLGERHLATNRAAILLADVLAGQGRTSDAEALLDAASVVAADAFGETHPQRPRAYAALARFRDRLRRHADAAPVWALLLDELAAGQSSPERDSWIVQAIENQVGLGQCPDDRLFKLIEPIYKSYPPGSRAWGNERPPRHYSETMYGYAEALFCRGRVKEAAAAFDEMRISFNDLPDTHPLVIGYQARRYLRLAESDETADASGAFGDFGDELADRARARRALYASADAAQVIGARALAGPLDDDGLGIAFEAFLNSAWRKTQVGKSTMKAGSLTDQVFRKAIYDPIRDKAFTAAQDLHQSSAAQAQSDAVARSLDPSGALTGLVERQTALAAKAIAIDRALLGGDSAKKPELDAALAELTGVRAEIARAFPRYAALTQTRTLDVKAVQERLAADEALLLIVPAGKDMHVFALSKTATQWHSRRDGARFAATRIARLRCQLDAATCAGSDQEAAPGEFDRSAAFELYRELVAPLEPVIGNTPRLLVAVAGDLSGLPLAVLPTGPGADAAWLGERHALVALPAVATLATRGIAPAPTWQRYLVGFGDPVFSGAARATDIDSSRFFAGRGDDGVARADVAELRTMARLPGTRIELDAMAKAVGSDRATLTLGAAATETAVKDSTDIPEARLLVFATHGVLPRSIGSVAEPGLVFTPPGTASARDDGLLTASEAAALKLKAELLILSACNSASGDGRPGGESLSGLARAFLYAGARALMVSHWRVADDATAALNVEMLRLGESGSNRADALQAAQRAVRTGKRADGSALDGWKAGWAHPSAWGAFVLIEPDR